MFKIESYITPILMNYVAKYVKNIRPQDAQLSLWGGEVALQNLDLRLDVLEEELQLPFEFLSGHIHELIIHVPWTKITSEPIQITINTIEFVLKLKDLNDKNGTGTNTSGNTSSSGTTTNTTPTSTVDSSTPSSPSAVLLNRHNERRKKLSRIDDVQQQQGYVPGLVNKIINNISINCHNIILKYVEEDIVVSMNIQLLSLNSANENWSKTFLDYNQTKVVLRKLIQISDLTICLDKRNSIGLIDVCQEPILYRCSLEIRLIKKYNLATMLKKSYTRIDIYSKSMEINISSLQFPMVMRLLLLMKILKDGNLNKNESKTKKKSDHHNINIQINDINDLDIENNDLTTNETSYLSWAWNLIPSVFPGDTEQIDNENDFGHTLNICVYLSKLNITLKSSELFVDSIVQSTKKIRYDPIIKISLEGIYSETNMIGRKWFNTMAGVSKILLEPLGNYANNQSSSNSAVRQSSYIIFTNPIINDNYLENSLFNEKGNLNKEPLTQLPINLENHLNDITEDYLLDRTPIFAFDMIHYLDIPDDCKSSDYDSDDLEYSNLSEQLLCRLFLSSITFKYNSQTLKIIDAIQDLIKTYNYTPYIENRNEIIIAKIPPPSVDDFDALMKEIPTRIYEITIRQSKIELYPKPDMLNMMMMTTTTTTTTTTATTSTGTNVKQQIQKCKKFNTTILQKIPFVNITFDLLYLKWTRPLYSNRVVYTTSQLPERPQQFMNSCYDVFQLNGKNINFQLIQNHNQNQIQDNNLHETINFLSIPELFCNYNEIIKPEIWPKDQNIIMKKFYCNIKEIKFEFTKFEFQIVSDIIELLLNTSNQQQQQQQQNLLIHIYNLNTLQLEKNENLKRIKINLKMLKISTSTFSDVICYNGKLKSIIAYIMDNNSKSNEMMNELIFTTINTEQSINSNSTLTSSKLNNKKEISNNFCHLIIQWPICTTGIINKPPFLAVLISNFQLIINNELVKFLTNEEISFTSEWGIEEENEQNVPRQELDTVESSRKSTVIHDQRTKKQFSQPQESVHLSSEKEDNKSLALQKTTKTEETEGKLNKKLGPILKCLVIWIDIKQNTIIITKESLYYPSKKIDYDSTTILLPSVQCKCKELGDIKEININFPIHKIFKEWKSTKTTFPWTCQLNDLIIKTNNKKIEKLLVYPINANVTLALDDKKHEKFSNTDDNKQKSFSTSLKEKEEEEEILAFNLHIDTKPIFMELSEKQALILRHSITLLKTCLELLNNHEKNLTNLRNMDDIENDAQTSNDNATIKEIKDFLALNTNSEDNSSHTFTNYSLTHNKQTIIVLLMQWTITKITFSLIGSINKNDNYLETKINFDIEDFIISLDYQLDYFKFKCKIGSLNMQYYEKNQKNIKEDKGNNTIIKEWKKYDYFKIKIRTITDNTMTTTTSTTTTTTTTAQNHHHTSGDTFFDLTLTIAEASDYFRRLGVKKNIKSLNKSIAEIDMHIKGIDILLDIEKVIKFLPIFYCLSSIMIDDDNLENNISSYRVMNVKSKKHTSTLITDLPLLFAESQGITIYIPVRTEKSWCDVFIFKIGEMYITPLVKHPLARNPLRPDIYNKAAQLQILDIPGSKLEDRQYEFSIQNISAATGNWKDILDLMKENSVKLKNTNPAFEWNHQSKKTSLELNSIFNDFLITITYAPYMIYKNVLVCGTAIEINCVTDLIMNLNTHQLYMMNVLLESLQDINRLSSIYKKHSTSKLSNIQPQKRITPTKLSNKKSQNTITKNESNNTTNISVNRNKRSHDNQTYLSERETTDSGIASSSLHRPKILNRKIKHKSNSKELILPFGNNKNLQFTTEFYIPYKIELVAGLFIFKFFQNARTNEINIQNMNENQEEEPSSSTSSSSSSATSYNNLIYPLAACTIKTSMLIEYKSTEFIGKFFIYTINIDNGLDDSKNLKIFETLTGHVGSTGIPPALLQIEYKIRTYSKKTEIDCVFGCPVKFYVSNEILKHLFNIYHILNETFDLQTDSKNDLKNNSSITSTSDVKLSPLSIQQEYQYHHQQQHQQQQQQQYRKTKIQIIQKMLYNANKLSITTDKFFIELHNQNTNNDENNTDIDSFSNYNIQICFGDINSILTIIEHPEKLSFYISTNTFYIKINDNMFLHPIKFKIKLLLIQDNWNFINQNPSLNINSKFDVIHFDINSQNIQILYNLKNNFEKINLNENDKILKKSNIINNDKNDKNKMKSLNNNNLLEKIHLPEPKRISKKSNNKEEFYQDDLRAGAFQFIELYDNDMNNDNGNCNENNLTHSLPHPYQIQIISKNNGIICWRYPQPRRICKLQIFPVPMDVSQPLAINCRMEYYSEPHSDFLYYCDFNITEVETKDIELPDDKITACIWRVIILQSIVTVNENCFKEVNSEGDEDSMDENNDYININDILKTDSKKLNFILQPKSLVACMRIDTAFSPLLIPKIKFVIELSLIQINLQNEQQKYININLPKPLNKYKLIQNNGNKSHTYLTLLITNTKMYTKFLNLNEYSISTDLTFSLKCLDYCCLKMFNLIEDTNLKSLLNIKNGIDINIVIDTIKFNLSTACLHTLNIAQQLCIKYFNNNNNNNNDNDKNNLKHFNKNQIVIWSRYVICNHTQLMFRIGQNNTKEMINIPSGNCIFYSFRSYYQNKELIFQIILPSSLTDNTNMNINDMENNQKKFITSCPISIEDVHNNNNNNYFDINNDNNDGDRNDEKFILLGENILILKIFRLSLTQKCILIKGQIDVISMTKNKFRIQFRSSNTYGSIPECLINDNDHISIFGKFVENEETYFRLRFSETTGEQFRWSGEIPLKSRKGLPWLVKIPTNSNPEFISFWVRVIRENINLSTPSSSSSSSTNSSADISNLKPIRILIVIYPMFVIQSNFTLPLTASINSTVAHNEKITLNGKGKIEEIQVAATNETQHEVTFENEFPKWHGEDRHNAILTFSNIDWDKFFWYDDKKIGIKEFINRITEFRNKTKWPYFEVTNNINVIRDIQADQSTLNTVPFIKCSPNYELSCSLSMKISPWCLFINTLQHDVEIKSSTTNHDHNDDIITKVNSGKIAMLFPIENSFLLDINFNDDDDNNSDATVSKSLPGFCSSSAIKVSIEYLQQNHLLSFIIHKGNFILRILLEYKFVDSLRLIILSSPFTIINNSIHKIFAYPFCLKNGEKVDRQYLEKTKQYRIKIPNKTSSAKGLSLDKFYDFKINDCQKITTKTQLQYFVCLTIQNDELSLPLPLNEVFNRKCFSLYSDGKSYPFAAICIEKKLSNSNLKDILKSQYYLFIYNDTSPILLIDNQTHFSYYVAESTIKSTKSLPHSMPSTSSASPSNNDDQREYHNKDQTEIIPECNENYILWSNILRPMCQTYYTPPSAYLTFPDTEKYHCDITLALKSDENKICSTNKIQWTTPIHTGYRSEKYINVPLHGDVKIVVCDKHNTIKLFIFYVSEQTEFCIKDLRTRLSDPDKTTIINNNSQEFQNQLKDNQNILNSNMKKYKNNDNYCNNIENVKRQECNHKLPDFSINLNIYANEISYCIWSEHSKQRKYHKDREIFSLNIDDLIINYNGLFKTLEININNIQADNQLYSTGNYDFPVILCSEKTYEKQQKFPNPSDLKKFLKSSFKERPLCLIHYSLYDNFSIETIHVQINPIRLYIEDTYIFDTLEELLYNSGTSSNNMIHTNDEQINIFCGPGEILIPQDILQNAIFLSEPLKLRYIRIDPINMNLSVHSSLKMYVGFDHSPLGFSQFDKRNLFTVATKLEQTLIKHYVSGLLFSCGWVVGCLEFLGSPSGLARSFTTGIRDFVSMPIQGFFRGPWGFVLGISQGSISLFRNVTAGALNSVTKLAVSVSRNLDRLTLDEEHLQRTEALRRSRPQGITQGLSNGLTGLGINILGAIGGLSRHTLEAKSTVGVVTGLGKGLFGAIAKPISGAADLVALTGQGMLHTVGYNTLPEQRSRSTIRTIIAYPAECKILWQLLPSILSTDQILFYHEATLVAGDELRHVQLILTKTILTVFDMEKDDLIDILPIEKVEMAFDNIDKTLINIKLLQENDEGDDEDSSFTNERIIRFLKASNDSLPSITTRYSLDDLLQINQKTRLQWSLYVSEHLGQHLFGYLKLIKSLSKKTVNQEK